MTTRNSTALASSGQGHRSGRFMSGILLACVLSLLIVGCAPDDALFSEANETVIDRTGFETAWTRGSEEDELADSIALNLMSDGLTLEDAIRIALIKNRSLQAMFERLGVRRGALIEASLANNPVFIGAWKEVPAKPGVMVNKLVIVEDLMSIITIPLRRRIAGDQLKAAKLTVAAETIRLIADVKRSVYEYQANKAIVELRQLMVQTAKVDYMLAARLRESGSISQRLTYENRLPYELMKTHLNTAVEALAASRERLNVLMNLWGELANWEITEKLPAAPIPDDYPVEAFEEWPGLLREEAMAKPALADLTPAEADSYAKAMVEQLAGPPYEADIAGRMPEFPQEADSAPYDTLNPDDEKFQSAEGMAVARSLELAALRLLIDAQGERRDLRILLAAFPFWTLGGLAQEDPNKVWGGGPVMNLPIPIVNWGQAQWAIQGSELRARVEDYAASSVTVRAATRFAVTQVVTTRSRAVYYQKTIYPLQVAVTATSQLQYNAVQISPLALYQAKIVQIQTAINYVNALRMYWMAQANLEQILDGSLPVALPMMKQPVFAPPEVVQPAIIGIPLF